MKIVIYGKDSDAGKARTKELRAGTATGEKVTCQLIQAEACNEAEECDELEFMPDVSAYDRERLNILFGKLGQPYGAAPADATQDAPPTDIGLKVGLGPGGRIYIRKGREIHSGPFDTSEAAEAALAALSAT